MKSDKTLKDVAIGQLCEIKDAGGRWRVTAIASEKREVQNTKSDQIMWLDNKTEVTKIYA